MIHLLFTGGTISMHRDAAAGGNVPAHGGEALVGFAPELSRVGPYRIEDWARLPACHFGPELLWALRERVRAVAESGEVAGIVVTHGTDILEETAYLLARTLDPRVPVAITGAMRTSSDAGWDGPRNLVDAARVARRWPAPGGEPRWFSPGECTPARARPRPTPPIPMPFPRPTPALSGAWTPRGWSTTGHRRRARGSRPGTSAREWRWCPWSWATTAECSMPLGRRTTAW